MDHMSHIQILERCKQKSHTDGNRYTQLIQSPHPKRMSQRANVCMWVKIVCMLTLEEIAIQFNTASQQRNFKIVHFGGVAAIACTSIVFFCLSSLCAVIVWVYVCRAHRNKCRHFEPRQMLLNSLWQHWVCLAILHGLLRSLYYVRTQQAATWWVFARMQSQQKNQTAPASMLTPTDGYIFCACLPFYMSSNSIYTR